MDIKNNVCKFGNDLQKPLLWGQKQFNVGLSLMKDCRKVQDIALGSIKIIGAALAVIFGLVPYAIGKAMQKAFEQKEVKPVVAQPQHPETEQQPPRGPVSSDSSDQSVIAVAQPTTEKKPPKNSCVNNNKAMPEPKDRDRFRHNPKYDGERQDILDSLYHGRTAQETVAPSSRKFQHNPKYDGFRNEIKNSFIYHSDERPINVADSVERPINSGKPQSTYFPRKEPAFDVEGPVHYYLNGQWVSTSIASDDEGSKYDQNNSQRKEGFDHEDPSSSPLEADKVDHVTLLSPKQSSNGSDDGFSKPQVDELDYNGSTPRLVESFVHPGSTSSNYSDDKVFSEGSPEVHSENAAIDQVSQGAIQCAQPKTIVRATSKSQAELYSVYERKREVTERKAKQFLSETQKLAQGLVDGNEAAQLQTTEKPSAKMDGTYAPEFPHSGTSYNRFSELPIEYPKQERLLSEHQQKQNIAELKADQFLRETHRLADGLLAGETLTSSTAKKAKKTRTKQQANNNHTYAPEFPHSGTSHNRFSTLNRNKFDRTNAQLGKPAGDVKIKAQVSVPKTGGNATPSDSQSLVREVRFASSESTSTQASNTGKGNSAVDDMALALRRLGKRPRPVNVLPYLLRIDTIKNNIFAAVAGRILAPVQELKSWAIGQMPIAFM